MKPNKTYADIFKVLGPKHAEICGIALSLIPHQEDDSIEYWYLVNAIANNSLSNLRQIIKLQVTHNEPLSFKGLRQNGLI